MFAEQPTGQAKMSGETSEPAGANLSTLAPRHPAAQEEKPQIKQAQTQGHAALAHEHCYCYYGNAETQTHTRNTRRTVSNQTEL